MHLATAPTLPNGQRIAERPNHPGTMASFLRGKQAGMQKDLSAAILPHLFAPDEQARFGINSQIR